MSASRDFQKISISARKSIVEIASMAKAAHVGSSLSVVEILIAAYTHAQAMSEGSKVLLSKGHAAAAVYAVLAEIGLIPKDMLKTYCEDGSLLSGHASHRGIPAIPISTGSLGHALPIGTGIALNSKLTGSRDETVVVLSDGECDEGSNWEAALFASHHKLSNLKVIIDRNGWQSISTTEATLALEPLEDKWRAFGWETKVSNGHDVQELLSHLKPLEPAASKPMVIIATTTKGKGVSFMEDSNLWHYRPPNSEETGLALTELGLGLPS
jgi:transketolase